MSEIENYFKKLTDAQLKKVSAEAGKDSFTIEGKTYSRRKVTTREFNQLERARAAFAKEQDPEKATEILMNLYKDAAAMYLGMTEQEFFAASWEETKLAVDACNHRTVYGSAFL